MKLDEHYPKFWMVFNPSHGNPKFKHYSRAAAVTEAARLASVHIGANFYVLEVVAVAETAPNPVRITNL